MEIEALAYSVARKIFSQKTRDRLKLVQYNLKAKMAPLRKAYYGSYDTAALRKELEQKLPQDFEVLMVHSSHAGLLPMYTGHLKQLLQILLDLCGKNRTLAMPAFFFGSAGYHYDVIKYFRDQSKFDLYDTPSQMGLLTELFRNHPGAKISHHPTHRVIAFGPHADDLVNDHENCRYSCGTGSPFHKMALDYRTLICGLGIPYFRCMTQMHCPEHILLEEGRHPREYNLNTAQVIMIDDRQNEIHYTLTVPRAVEKHRPPPITSTITQWQFHGSELFYSWAHEVQETLFKGYQRLENQLNTES